MPVYDYLCPACGPFSVLRPMAEFEAPYPCAGCGVETPRALLTPPAMSGMDPSRRAAFATNERSANAPLHRQGTARSEPRTQASGSTRTTSGRRPWMLGH